MKNYYETLGLEQTATTEEITASYNNLMNPTDGEKLFEEQEQEVLEAYEVLSDAEKKDAYDKEIAIAVVNKEIDKPKKGISNFKVTVICLAIVATTFIICNKGSLTKNANTTETPKESTDKDLENDKTVELTAANYNEVADSIATDSKSKGLDIDETFIKSALFVTNIDTLSEADIKTLYENGDFNIIEEIQNMYNYTSAVGTNNTTNGKQFISLTNLIYDEDDKLITEALENELISLKEGLANNTITNDEFQASFKKIKEFYLGTGSLVLSNGKSYNNDSLTSGGGLLTELYWPMFAITYSSSEFQTTENRIDIQTLSTEVINGSKYLGEIVNHKSLNCLDEQNKTLTK